MIIKYTKNLIAISLIVSIIISSSIGSFGNSTIRIFANEVDNRGSISIIKTRTQTFSYKTYLSSFMDDGFNDTDNIVVTNTIGDESFPSMVLSGFDALIAYDYKFGNSTYVYLRNSLNY